MQLHPHIVKLLFSPLHHYSSPNLVKICSNIHYCRKNIVSHTQKKVDLTQKTNHKGIVQKHFTSTQPLVFQLLKSIHRWPFQQFMCSSIFCSTHVISPPFFKSKQPLQKWPLFPSKHHFSNRLNITSLRATRKQMVILRVNQYWMVQTSVGQFSLFQ